MDTVLETLLETFDTRLLRSILDYYMQDCKLLLPWRNSEALTRRADLPPRGGLTRLLQVELTLCSPLIQSNPLRFRLGVLVPLCAFCGWES
jgi:hypothetical protein